MNTEENTPPTETGRPSLAGSLLLPLIMIDALLDGLLLSILWGWFLVPLGLPSIGMAHATGVALTVSVLTMRSPKTAPEPPAVTLRRGAIFMASKFIIALLIGALAHSAM